MYKIRLPSVIIIHANTIKTVFCNRIESVYTQLLHNLYYYVDPNKGAISPHQVPLGKQSIDNVESIITSKKSVSGG